jgi:hypothetical protein
LLRPAWSIFQNARGNSPIAQTFERDLGFFAWYLADPRSTGHAALDLEAQSFGGGLGIGRYGKVDEIGHANLHVSNLVKNFGRNSVAPDKPYIETPA